MDIFREMYAKADPPANLDELIKSGVSKKENFFMNYYLPEEEQIEIIDKHIRKHKLSKYEKEIISVTVNLGPSPTSIKKG